MLLHQQTFGDLAVLDNLHWSRSGQQRRLVIDPQQMIDRRGIIWNGERIIIWLAAGRVSRAMNVTLFDPTAGHDDAEYFRIMVASRRLINLRRAAKFSGDQHKR